MEKALKDFLKKISVEVEKRRGREFREGFKLGIDTLLSLLNQKVISDRRDERSIGIDSDRLWKIEREIIETLDLSLRRG